ncbi:MAG: PKD domain-containing protein [Isosphaeraceae bacterium]|nr:PKD domain-containing protein [Isosphaeraceae bacterium]
MPGWSARALVEVSQGQAEPGADTAALRVLCQGRGRPDGADFRVVDAGGKPAPFQVAFHDAPRYALLSFRAAPGRYFVYFGNPGAARAAEQVPEALGVGAGPPKGDWIPRQGLVLQTLRRPAGENPKTVEEMARLIAASPAKDGARYQRRVADGFNPFGSSDGYISIYRGWIQVPKAGKYKFCTASNEASFSFLDGKELVHWPGRHTVERGMRGEKNATVDLPAGPHYLEYYQEEVALEQMAYLGWRPSGDDGPFEPIPKSVFVAPLDAKVARYEGPDGQALPAFEPVVVDSIWPTDRHEGQYTRVRFQATEGADCQWEFGDGQTASGAKVEHVYLALGTYEVTLKAGGKAVRWPLTVFEIENVTDQFLEGRPRDYAKLTRTYDLAKLDAPGLRELAHLLAESEEPATALEAGKRYVERFGVSHPKTVPRMRRLMADCSLQLGQGGVEEAVGHFQASLTDDTPPAERLDVLARLIHLLGIDRSLPEQAGALLPQVEAAVKGAKLDDATLAAYRRAVIAAADVLLWNGKIDGAHGLYDRAEKLGGRFIPRQVRAARVGAYPGAIRDYIDGGNFGAALDIVDQWDETFPTDKPNGQTFFWRGKLLMLRGQPKEAARHLARAVGLAPGAASESEARWLLAEALDQSGKPEDARKELARLIASGVNDAFSQRARERLGRNSKP